MALALNDFAVDTRRFQGLGPEWFSEIEFRIPTEPTWREKHAKKIAEWRIDNAATMEETANRFGKTVPTIRAALREAKGKHGINATGKEIIPGHSVQAERTNKDASSSCNCSGSQEGGTVSAFHRYFCAYEKCK